MKIARHYVDEWERYPDLFTLEPEPSADDANLYAARQVARLFSDAFMIATPSVKKNNRRDTCLCTLESEDGQTEISLCANFTIGQLLHELTHAVTFFRYGDHRHDAAFSDDMGSVCDWFRACPAAQAVCFP